MAFSPLATVLFGAIMFRPIASLSCVSTNDPATVVPLGLIYRRPGDYLKLLCLANFSHEMFLPGIYGPESLFFTRVVRGEEFGPLPKTIVNETVIETTVSNLTWEDAGRYVCKFNTMGGSERNLCSSQLFIGLDPLPLEDFRCVSNALESLECSWTVPPDVIANTEYKVGYRIYNDSRALYYGCEKTTRPMESGDPDGPNRFNCTFKDAQYNALSENLYFFFGAHSPFLDRKYIPLPTIEFHNFRNVRPSPPEGVDAIRIGPRNATIQWKIRDKVANLKDVNGLVHEISYQSSFEVDPVKLYVNTTRENLEDLYVRHTLENLDHPWTNYTVVIRSICGEAEYDDLWSGYSRPFQFQTLPDAPDDAPFIPAGAYYFDSDGALTIYWDRVSQQSHNGPKFRYVIDYADGFVSARKEADAESFAMKLNGTQIDRPVNFSVSAINEVGMKLGGVVHVPARSSNPLSVKVTLEKPGQFLISWTPVVPIEEVDFYSIFYCEKKPPDEHNQRCKTQPERLQVNGTVTSQELQLAEDKFYLFAVNSFSEHGSAPLKWTTINGGDPDGEIDYSVRVGLIVGGTILAICIALAYPSIKWAKRKYAAFTKFPTIIVPKLVDEGVRGEKTSDWPDKRPPVTTINGKMGDDRISEFAPTPVLSRMTERFSTDFSIGLGRGIPKVDSHPYDMVNIYSRDVGPLEEKIQGNGPADDDDEGGSTSTLECEVERKLSTGSLEPDKKAQFPGYVILGETDAKVVASVEELTEKTPTPSTHYVMVGNAANQPQPGGYVIISPSDYCPPPDLQEDVLDPSGVTFTVDVDVTVGTNPETPPSPSQSRESDPGYVSSTAVDETPSPFMDTPPTVHVPPSGYVPSF